MGAIYKNFVDPHSAEKLLSKVEEMNKELQEGKYKKRMLK